MTGAINTTIAAIVRPPSYAMPPSHDEEAMAPVPAPGHPAPLSAFRPPSVHPQPLLAGDSYTHFSPVPAALLPPSPDEPAPPCALGVDEAGRGPVLGPMVYGVFFLPLPLSDPLLRHSPHRFDDSKVLTPVERSRLMRALCSPASDLHASCGWATAALSARDISVGMLRPVAPYNLNAQAMDATVGLIRGVCDRGVNVHEIYVDTVGPPAAYQARLQRLFPSARVTVAKKADSLYPCVSAASVCAKVTRDAALELLYRARAAGRPDDGGPDEGGEKVEDEEQDVDVSDHERAAAAMAWGSGYPSDGRCTAWMRSNMHPVFGWGPECRFSWGTAKEMLEAKDDAVRVDWPLDDDRDGNASTVTDYFSAETCQRHADELGTWFGTPAGLEAF